MHQTAYWFNNFNYFHAGKRLSIQTPNYFLSRWFHHLNAPDLNVSSATPFFYPYTKPFIILFQLFNRTSTSSQFHGSLPLATISSLISVASFPPKVPSYSGDDVIAFCPRIFLLSQHLDLLFSYSEPGDENSSLPKELDMFRSGALRWWNQQLRK